MKVFIVAFVVLLCDNVVSVSRLRLSTVNNVNWTLENSNGSISIPATVPGGVYSDLAKAGIIEDIFKGFNDVLTRWVAYDSWTYTGTFEVTQEQLGHEVIHMVFHGVDTIADIELNGRFIGSTKNMFLRYVFDVQPHIKAGPNVLIIRFSSPVEEAKIRSEKFFTEPACVPEEYNGECHANQLRKMQASFSWDWGPAFPSVGLWKYAELEFYNNVILRTITTQTEKKGASWDLKVKAHLESSMKPKQVMVQMTVTLVVGNNKEYFIKTYSLATRSDGTGEVEMEIKLSENVINLWWPNGYGEQALYDIIVSVNTQGAQDFSFIEKKIGFRTVRLVQSNASEVLGNTTAGEGLTFYFEVNGMPLFMKGSNWIPQHILPELGYQRGYMTELLTAAKEAHMSMLRVWGGGLYEDEYFYELCDQYGILIWQDFPFACSMYPADEEFLNNVKDEIAQNIINLQTHPSIALWAGNNENEAALRGNWYNTMMNFDKYKEEYIALYVDTIKPIVKVLDERPYLVSSPGNGDKSESEGYIAENPYDPHYGDTHYYNYVADNWDFNIYPKTRFASEYGVQSMPSLATLRQAIDDPKDLSMGSDFIKHRQHSPNGYANIENQMNKHLKLEKNDTNYFEKFVFYSQISQAMSIKTQTEYYRQSQADWYTMGALYWQLNDVWQAPSWSGIEFGGKKKMMHYFAKKFFSPVLVSPRLLSTGDVDIYLLNDRFVPIIDARIVVDVFRWDSLVPVCSPTYEGYVPALSSKRQPFRIIMWNQNTDEIFLRFSLQEEGVKNTPYNYIFPKPLHSIKGLRKPNIEVAVSNSTNSVSKDYEYTVEIKMDTIVLFLWLETEDGKGNFRDNGFVVTEPVINTYYTRHDYVSPEDLQNNMHYQYYLH